MTSLYTFFVHLRNFQASMESSLELLLSWPSLFVSLQLVLKILCQIFNQSGTKPSQFWLGYLGFPIPWAVFLFLVRVMNGLLCYSFCYDTVGCSCHSDFGLTTLNCKVHLFGFDRWWVSKETVSDAVSVAGVASISLNEGLIQKNVSFKNSLQWPIDKINSVD